VSDTTYLVLGIAGLAAVTVLTRAFFLIPGRKLALPPRALQGLRYAPLAALCAAIAPEIVLRDGVLVASWQDARLLAALAGSVYFYWRRGILGTIVSGTAVLLALKVGLGW
jgi:branched-subunit amino acid transport protein